MAASVATLASVAGCTLAASSLGSSKNAYSASRSSVRRCYVAGLGLASGKATGRQRPFARRLPILSVRASLEDDSCLVPIEQKAVNTENPNPNPNPNPKFSFSLKTLQQKLSEPLPKLPKWVEDGLSEAATFFKNPAVVALLLAVLFLSVPDFAMAAQGGGRVGGRVSAPSRSYSPPSRSYSAPSRTYVSPSPSFSTPYFAPSPFFGGWGWSPFYAGPTVIVGGGGGGFGGVFSLLIAGVMVMFVANAVFGFLGDREEDDVYSTTTSVLRVQVGLLGMARSLQRDLDRIAERADTSSAEGLHYVLTETALALLRHPDYCVYGTGSSAVKRSSEEGESVFNSMSLEERGKFQEETLVNVGDIQRRVNRMPTREQFTSEYIVVTILVATDGSVKLPEIKSSADLRNALTTLGSVPVESLQAVEILWTPQNDGDTLSEREMLSDYPQLRSL